MVSIREATEADVEGIQELFTASYGPNYCHPEYYDLQALRKLVYADNSLLLVAEEEGTLLGTASVVMHVGAYNDLVGEFGRLVVDPNARGKGIGQQLMQSRIDRVKDRLHVGMVENRTVHDYSQRISSKHGFACVGFLPFKLLTDRRESLSLYARYFDDALKLRRNHPHVLSEAVELAELSMSNLGMEPDVIADVSSTTYVLDSDFELKQMNTEGYSTLLRLERGRVHSREIVGPLRLHYGLFQIKARKSTYLIARTDDRIAGAIGFAHDHVENTARVFELISATERPVRFLLEEFIRICDASGDVDYIEVDVNADAPRMQRTLLELGFFPCAYVPAMTFHQVERLDIVKMARLRETRKFSDVKLADASRPIAQLVQDQFAEASDDPRVLEAASRSRLFAGLNREQVRHLARKFSVQTFRPGNVIFSAGANADSLYLILKGVLTVTSPNRRRHVADLAIGDCVGERSLMTQRIRTLSTHAATESEVAALSKTDIEALVRKRPDIGVVLYRNLATELAEKLSMSIK